jgi:hypothetical protein
MRQKFYEYKPPEEIYDDQGNPEVSLLSPTLRESFDGAIQECRKLLRENTRPASTETMQYMESIIFSNFLAKQRRLQPLELRQVRRWTTPVEKALVRRNGNR